MTKASAVAAARMISGPGGAMSSAQPPKERGAIGLVAHRALRVVLAREYVQSPESRFRGASGPTREERGVGLGGPLGLDEEVGEGPVRLVGGL